MAVKRRGGKSGSLLSAQNTISIGTAVAILGLVIWLTWYAGGLVRDLDGLKSAVAEMRPLVADLPSIKAAVDRIEGGRSATTRK